MTLPLCLIGFAIGWAAGRTMPLVVAIPYTILVVYCITRYRRKS